MIDHPKSPQIDEREQQLLLDFIRPSVDQEISKLSADLEQINHSRLRPRVIDALALIQTFPQLRYEEYRTLVGALNFMRSSRGAESWKSILEYFEGLSQDPETPNLKTIGQLIGRIGREEAHRSPKYYGDRDPNTYLQPLTSSAFIENLLFIFRVLYPLGVNVLNPSWLTGDQTETSLALSKNIHIKMGQSRYGDYVTATRSKKHPERFILRAYQARTPRHPIGQTTLRPQSQVCVGRGRISSRHFLGLPISCAAGVDLKVGCSMWSRASLRFVLDAESKLYILDRASKNQVTCVVDDSLIYRQSLPHSLQELIPNQLDPRDARRTFNYRPDSIILSELGDSSSNMYSFGRVQREVNYLSGDNSSLSSRAQSEPPHEEGEVEDSQAEQEVQQEVEELEKKVDEAIEQQEALDPTDSD